MLPDKFHGPNYATCSACAPSTNAIADAFNLIRLGKANAIISGGSEAAIAACGVGGFNAMHALSTRNDSPETASRPFSASRDGFIMVWFLKNWNMPKHVVPRFMQRLPV